MSATRLKIFISSVQNEFSDIRRDLKAFLTGDAFLRRFISDVFLFEELPAKDQRTDLIYLKEVERCDIYLGIFGYEYGYETESGISPTEQEFNHATENSKTRLIYIWGTDDNKRHPKMQKLVKKVSKDLVRRRVESFNSLASEVYASLVDYLDNMGALKIAPFDAAPAENATLKSLSKKRFPAQLHEIWKTLLQKALYKKLEQLAEMRFIFRLINRTQRRQTGHKLYPVLNRT